MPHGLMEALFPVKSQNHSRVPNVRQMLGHDCRNDIWSRVQVWSLAWLPLVENGFHNLSFERIAEQKITLA